MPHPTPSSPPRPAHEVIADGPPSHHAHHAAAARLGAAGRAAPPPPRHRGPALVVADRRGGRLPGPGRRRRGPRRPRPRPVHARPGHPDPGRGRPDHLDHPPPLRPLGSGPGPGRVRGPGPAGRTPGHQRRRPPGRAGPGRLDPAPGRCAGGGQPAPRDLPGRRRRPAPGRRRRLAGRAVGPSHQGHDRTATGRSADPPQGGPP